MAGSEQVGDQIVSLTGNAMIELAKGTIHIGGQGGKKFSELILSTARQERKTRGQVRVSTMLRDNLPLNVFSIDKNKFTAFTEQAYKYGVRYSAIVEKDKPDSSVIDLLVFQQDAPRINKIIENIEGRKAGLESSDISREDTKDITDEMNGKEASVELAKADMHEQRWDDMEPAEKKLQDAKKKEADTELAKADVHEENWDDLRGFFNGAETDREHPSRQNFRGSQGSDHRPSVKAQLSELTKQYEAEKKAAKAAQKAAPERKSPQQAKPKKKAKKKTTDKIK